MDYLVRGRFVAKLISPAGTIMYKCLTMMGLPSDKIHVHHLAKGTNIHTDQERDIMQSYAADRLIVLDQGSRPGPELISTEEGESKSLIIDHHLSSEVRHDRNGRL